MKQKYLNLFAMFLLFVSLTAKAQSDKPAISIGPEVGLPFNTEHNYIKTRDVYQPGVGASIKLELPVSSGLKFTATAGYLNYASNEHLLYATTLYYPPMGGSSTLPAYEFIPLKVGLRYYYAKSFYLDADAGEAFKAGGNAKNSFIYAAAFGALIPFSKHHGLDLNARYENGYKSKNYDYAMQQLGIRLAYRYSF